MRLMTQPTITMKCPYPGCKRTVGGYFTQEYAIKALQTHLKMRHHAVRMARTVVDGSDGPGQ